MRGNENVKLEQGWGREMSTSTLMSWDNEHNLYNIKSGDLLHSYAYRKSTAIYKVIRKLQTAFE